MIANQIIGYPPSRKDGRIKCARWESNPHALTDTATSRLRVYHSATRAKQNHKPHSQGDSGSVRAGGFELPAYSLSGNRSNHLSYKGIDITFENVPAHGIEP